MSEIKQQQDNSPKKKRKPEKLNTNDIQKLMGMNRARYTRKNGAVRRK